MSASAHQDIIKELCEFEHVRIHRQCGACGFLFDVGDPLVALLHTGDPVACCKVLDAMDFPVGACGKIRQNRLFCSFPPCSRCEKAGETATIHVDCFNLYMKRAFHTDRLHRLWSYSLAKYPWPGCPALLLPSRLEAERVSSLTADIYNMERLASLPNEIATSIWNFVGQHCLLRFSTVLEAAEYLFHKASDQPTSVPLAMIEAWHRGSHPIIGTVGSNRPIKLAIDSRGIARIARPTAPVQESRSQFTLYTTIEANRNLMINFRFGISRLAPTPRPEQLQVTDIPNLSKLKRIHFPYQASTKRLTSINLASCSGITFFLATSDLLAIHAHTRTSPSAEVTFAQLPPTHQREVQWFHVPNLAEDKISAFGVQLRVLYDRRLRLNTRSHCQGNVTGVRCLYSG
ncbi:hypothetical protein LZ30DRAFT_650447 [Colletotrichum cereale]|nr:hypothetical protein LZ30DRAFT_650447 [Colletotrichum cereale]